MAQGVEFPQLVDRIPNVLADALGSGGAALMPIDDHDRSRAAAGSGDDGPAAGAGAGNGGPGKPWWENASARSW
jgi:hypothetical protein